MYHDILTNKRNLYKRISRRDFLLVLACLPFLNSFSFENSNFNTELKNIISKNGVAIIANIKTGQIIGCSNINKAFQGYTIGSLAKLITSTALLEEKVIQKDHSYYCKGFEIENGKKIWCWNPNGHGKLTLETAISESCNLYFKHYSKRIAPEDILKYYWTYNLENIEPAKELNREINYIIPPTGLNYEVALGLHKSLLLSPIQLLSLSCSIARGGIYKSLWFETPINKEEKLNISEDTLKIIQNGMVGSASTGTAELLRAKGFKAAAKTGTSPYYGKKTHGWCVGYTPVEDPEIAFCVFVNEGTGFSDAVPIAVRVLELCRKYGYA